MKRSAFALVLLCLSACGRENAAPDPDAAPARKEPSTSAAAADFQGSVTGAIDERQGGTTAFWITRSQDPPVEFFVLNLYPEGPGNRISFTRNGRGLPGPGTYPIQPQGADSAAFQLAYVVGGTTHAVYGTGGTLTLAAVSPERVEGRYEVDGQLVDTRNPTGGTQSVRLTGTFTARCDDSAEGNVCQ